MDTVIDRQAHLDHLVRLQTDNFGLIAANGKLKFVYLGRQRMNDNRRLLFFNRAHLYAAVSIFVQYMWKTATSVCLLQTETANFRLFAANG
jgi:hypothetical protein